MSDTDPTIKAVQQFEERVVEKEPAWLIKQAHKLVEKLVTSQSLEYPEPSCRFVSDLEKDYWAKSERTSHQGRYGEAEREDQ